MLVATSATTVSRRAFARVVSKRCQGARSHVNVAATARQSGNNAGASTAAAAATAALVASAVTIQYTNTNTTTSNVALCESPLLEIGKVTKEPATGIAFPQLCNGMTLAGVGVRIKYVFVKVYGVGAYFDPIAMMAVKKQDGAALQKALLDPTYPRTLRIVMNRGLGVDKFIAAIVEAVEPRLQGKNLETLDQFKEIFPKVDLQEGDEVEMTLRGDTLLLKTALTVATIQSRAFTEAMCDVYFGDDPVSPTLKEEVMKGIPKF